MASLISLLIPSLAGHVALWTWLYNRLHASSVPSAVVQKLEKFIVLAVIGTMALFSYLWLTSPPGPAAGGSLASWLGPIWVAACCLMLVHVVFMWTRGKWRSTDQGRLIDNETEVLDVVATLGYSPVGDRKTRWQSRIPGNQILEVHMQHKTLVMPGLPPALDGIRIAHVTDLHMTGQLQRPFFDAAIEQTNRWQADVVAITGDLVDKPPCIEWIPETLGRLSSRWGVFALLGNHDQRLADVALLRRTLTDCGIVDLGGRCVVHEFDGTPLLLAGNECPWFPPAPSIPAFDGERPFSILLSHSPDPLPWARRQQFDLMLAGHTHGGQIRFPWIGPVVCPSRFGVRYASGVFHEPPVLLHVSRGLSGVHTLRFNCPPEITLLELRRSNVEQGGT